MTVLPFSKRDYDKLNRKVFPTIRRRDKYGDVGTVNEIKCGPSGNRVELGEARVIAKEKITLGELPTSFLCWDTNVEILKQLHPRREAIDSINQFYRNPIDETEELTLYWNVWVMKYE